MRDWIRGPLAQAYAPVTPAFPEPETLTDLKKIRPQKPDDSEGNAVAESDLRGALRANMDETDLLVVITEQGENRNPCEEQRNIFGHSSFPHGFARRCAT